ncbi:MAG: GGDEF domain-containing protein, partial [Anaerolineaceae bacterium]|nr:GGDEF domain-containing protein [Anaerolineaceae bacterium]
MFNSNERFLTADGNIPIPAEAGMPAGITYAGVADVLAGDYFSIYLVDLETDRFFEYSSDLSYKHLQIDQMGEDFFGLSRRNAEKALFPEDRDRFMAQFTREKVIGDIREKGQFQIVYRLLLDGEPVFISLRASTAGEKDSSHIIVRVSNVNADMAQINRSLTYSAIYKALTGNFLSIYYVDMNTDEYVELSSGDEYSPTSIENYGGSFFDAYREKACRLIHPDDKDAFLEKFTKENIKANLSGGDPYYLNFRQQIDSQWVYLQMKVSLLEEKIRGHIVVGISNIDEQKRREEEQIEAVRIASHDALTGMKNRNLYIAEKKRIDSSISEGNAEPFALAFCDMNDLKMINDTCGHAEGDEAIKQACRTICNIFKHSPVFRVGGDEFVVILRNTDYEKRDYLYKLLSALNYAQAVGRKVVIACGIAEFQPDRDRSVEDVEK